jgi:hypothetical protein
LFIKFVLFTLLSDFVQSSRLRHYATSQKVSGSSPDEVTIFSFYLIVLAALGPGFTQPLTEMSSRSTAYYGDRFSLYILLVEFYENLPRWFYIPRFSFAYSRLSLILPRNTWGTFALHIRTTTHRSKIAVMEHQEVISYTNDELERNCKEMVVAYWKYYSNGCLNIDRNNKKHLSQNTSRSWRNLNHAPPELTLLCYL